VTCLFEDAEGTIWIGHQTGELTRYQDGKFRAVPVKANGTVEGFTESAPMWRATSGF
jgi:ligand-binding sensor domain-containing protein